MYQLQYNFLVSLLILNPSLSLSVFFFVCVIVYDSFFIVAFVCVYISSVVLSCPAFSYCCLVLSCGLSCIVSSRLVWSFLVSFCLALSCLVSSHLVLSHRVLSFLVSSHFVLSCLALSCLALSCLALSCLDLSCLVFCLMRALVGPFRR